MKTWKILIGIGIILIIGFIVYWIIVNRYCSNNARPEMGTLCIGADRQKCLNERSVSKELDYQKCRHNFGF